MKIVGDKYI